MSPRMGLWAGNGKRDCGSCGTMPSQFRLLAWDESDEWENLVFTSKRLKLLLIIKTRLTLWMKATNPNQISDLNACAMSNGVDHPDL
jgi:hypothetical protein